MARTRGLLECDGVANRSPVWFYGFMNMSMVVMGGHSEKVGLFRIRKVLSIGHPTRIARGRPCG